MKWRLTLLRLVAATLGMLCVVDGRGQPTAPALLHTYEYEEAYGCVGETSYTPDWCLDPGGRVRVSVTEDGVWIHGTALGTATVQTGMSFCYHPIASPQRLECAVVFEARSRDTAFVLEFYSLEYGCAVAQTRCSSKDVTFSAVVQRCPSPNVYPPANERLYAREDNAGTGTYILRMVYDATEKVITGYWGTRIIGRAPLGWAPQTILVRIFSEASRWSQGVVDVLIKEVHLGWDGFS